MKNSILLFFALFVLHQGFSQQVSEPINIDSHVLGILKNRGEEADNQPYYELLMHFYNNPIPINNCKQQDLDALQLLTTDQINDIVRYRDEYGGFTSGYELMAIPSLSIELIKNILPFLSFSPHESFGTVLKQSLIGKNNYILASGSRTVQSSYGFIKDRYLGDPFQYNLRVRASNPGHSSMGLSLQKDPGELHFRNDSLHIGPDFYSFHYYLQNQGKLKQFAIGDYKLQFGQGLLLGAGFLTGKNASTISSLQATLKVQPYTSLTEFNYFRGAGTTIRFAKGWEVSLFYSNQEKDATTYSSDSLITVRSFRTAGLHRTLSELSAQKSVREQVAGSAITYSKGSAEIGILGLYNSFNIPFTSKPGIYNQDKFTGFENYNVSVFGRYNYRNLTFYGEGANTLQNGFAFTGGLVAGLSKYLDFTFQYRYFDPNFHSFYGLSFAEGSSLMNERGAYWGVNIRLMHGLSLVGYYDMYSFPKIKSTIPKSGKGNDGLIRLNYKLHKSALFYLQVRNETKDKKIPDPKIQLAQANRISKYILNMDYSLENPLSFRTRFQLTYSYFIENDIGYLIYQDINLSIKRIALSARYAIFDTYGSLAKQYMYEKDLLYAFSTPQFNGRGIRYYALMKFTPFKGMSLRAKWAETVYYDRMSVGSGLDKIEGNKKSQVAVQLKYDF